MLLLDTAALPPRERAEAFHARMSQACAGSVRPEPSDGAFHARLRLWTLGDAALFTSRNSGFRLLRTARHVRADPAPVLALAVQAHGLGRFQQHRDHQLVGPADLMLNDLTVPYDFRWTGEGASRSFQVGRDRIGLPADVVRRAAFRLHTSPLHGVVHAHLRGLFARADSLAADPGAADLADATVGLVRALLVSAAAGGGRLAREVRADTMLVRVMAHMRHHLGDPGLTPRAVAAAHGISPRHLYKLFERAELSLEQWLIEQRLEAARADLADPRQRHRTVAAIARSRGFATPSHFARRFRGAYGTSPARYRAFGPGDMHTNIP